ncbi:deubiquitinase OTUD6B [Scaptodrosophila lebanonensis]|uniref:ubiquitinyl hydrolase 1 n=1 Tax=Drosophila lebanonensis TaxID=7225 RepID=A0A6J2TX62_DROLE|nr:deubiquitinase OTUD6B [Scaptodrosophila lebanonensis]
MASDDQPLGELEARLGEITLEDVNSRHRRERKELQAKLQALKKNAPKNDKKKRKEFLEQMAQLEGEMEQRHKLELQAAEKAAAMAATIKASEPQEAVDQQKSPESAQNQEDEHDHEQEHEQQPMQQRVSKAQKRRDKKEREARKREEEIREELEHAEKQPSAKLIELQQINEKLASRQVMIHRIPSDGDCLYNAVRHQLTIHGLPSPSVSELRLETANYVRAHKDTLICYMTHQDTGDLLNDAQFEEYCQAITNTHAWGGHIELKALSSMLRVPIEVLQAEGAPTKLGEEFGGAPLVICYHRHMYQLGEHYNSTLPLGG